MIYFASYAAYVLPTILAGRPDPILGDAMALHGDSPTHTHEMGKFVWSLLVADCTFHSRPTKRNKKCPS